MSLYNMLFGANAFGPFYLAMLGLTTEDVGRYRDCFLQKTDTGETRIVIFTRNGGGNRDDYAGTTEALQGHPEYVTDFDDEFDCTYASYVFKVPEKFKAAVDRLIEQPGQQVDPGARFLDLVTKMREGDDKDPDVQRALRIGQQILAPVLEAIEKDKAK